MSRILWTHGVPTDTDIDYWSNLGVSELVIDMERLWRLGGDHYSTNPRWLSLPKVVATAKKRGWKVNAAVWLVNEWTGKPMFAWPDNDWTVLLDSFAEMARVAKAAGVDGFGFDGELSYARGPKNWGLTADQNLVRQRGREIGAAIHNNFRPDAPLYCYNFASHMNGLYAEQTIYPGLKTDMTAFLDGIGSYCDIRLLDDVFYKSTQSAAGWTDAYKRALELWRANGQVVSDSYAPFSWLDTDGTTFGNTPITGLQISKATEGCSSGAKPAWYVARGIDSRLTPSAEQAAKTVVVATPLPPAAPTPPTPNQQPAPAASPPTLDLRLIDRPKVLAELDELSAGIDRVKAMVR